MIRRHLVFHWFLFLFLFFYESTHAQVPSYVPTSGLVAYYSLNGNLNDVTGSGNNGVAYGTVAYGTDRFGAALNCYKGNGAGEGDIPVNNFPTGNASRTISVFYKYQLPYAGGGRAFFGWGNNIFAGRFNLFASDTYVGVEYVNGVVRVASYTVDSCWHNLTATYPTSGSGSSSVKLYLDGYLVASSIILPTSTYNTPSGPWHGLGGNIYYLPFYNDSWTGYLDDIGVWNRELTATEVLQLWTGGGYPTSAGSVSLTGANTVCSGASTALSPSVAGGTWSITPASVATVVGGTVTGLSAGTAVVTYSASVGCTVATDTQMITVLPLPDPGVVSGPSTVCVGGSSVYTSSVPGGTWSSSMPSVATINSVGGSGGMSTGTAIISYSVTNACGTSTDTEMVSVITTPSPGGVYGPTTICPGTLVTYATSGAGGGSWSSSNIAAVTINASTGGGGGGASGTAIISYSVTNVCGTAVDTLLATIGSIVSAGVISGPTEVCAGANITLFDGVGGGVWSSGSPSIGTIDASTGVAGGVTPGVVTYYYSVSNSCGVATVSYVVTVNGLPAASIISGPRGACEGSGFNLSVTPATGSWSSSASGIATVNSSGWVSGNNAGNAIISYTVTNLCGSVSDTHAIVIDPGPDPGFITGSTLFLCTGQPLSLTSSVAGGVWSSTNPGVASINSSGVVTANTTGTSVIKYVVTNSYGCSDTATYLLTVTTPASLVITANIVQADCAGEDSGKIVLGVASGSGSYNYTWSNGANTATISGLAAGTYSVSIHDNITGCDISRSYDVADPDTLTVSAKITNTSCNKANGGIEVLGVSGGLPPYSYLWSNGSTNAILNNLTQGLYALTARDSKNCIARYSGVVAVDSCGEVIIYDVITPNGDGKNDIWVIEGIFAYPDNTVELFDKWGDRVFYAEGYKNNWGGSSGNGLLPDGTYFYLVKLNTTTGNGPKPMTGSLLIKH